MWRMKSVAEERISRFSRWRKSGEKKTFFQPYLSKCYHQFPNDGDIEIFIRNMYYLYYIVNKDA